MRGRRFQLATPRNYTQSGGVATERKFTEVPPRSNRSNLTNGNRLLRSCLDYDDDDAFPIPFVRSLTENNVPGPRSHPSSAGTSVSGE